jgi:hypothetical protein
MMPLDTYGDERYLMLFTRLSGGFPGRGTATLGTSWSRAWRAACTAAIRHNDGSFIVEVLAFLWLCSNMRTGSLQLQVRLLLPPLLRSLPQRSYQHKVASFTH